MGWWSIFSTYEESGSYRAMLWGIILYTGGVYFYVECSIRQI